MSKRKRQARKQIQRQQSPATPETRSWITRASGVWRVLIFLIGIPGLYVGVLSVFPRVSVSPNEQLKKYDPLSSPFIITNEGFLSIYSVSMTCKVDHLLLSTASQLVGVSFADGVVDDEVGPDGRITRFCKVTTPDPKMKEVIISMIVRFRPEFLPWTTTRAFHFRGYPSDDGTMHWAPYTPDKNWF